MNQHTHDTDKVVSLTNVVAYVRNVNLDKEIVMFDSVDMLSDIPPYPVHLDGVAIMLCTEGSGEICIDLNQYTIKKNSLIVVNSQNFIYGKAQQVGMRSHVLMCSHNVIEEILPKLSELFPFVLDHRLSPVIQLTESEANDMHSLYHIIKERLSRPETEFRRSKIMNLLRAYHYEMMEIYLSHTPKQDRRATRKEEIMAKFIMLLCEHFHEERQVSFYAEKLFITPKHLSAVAKETSGRTVGEWIENYVILEAKVLLKSTDMTIQEIASRLNFANQSFFGKYFKHLTGVSPTEFRKTT